MFSVIFEVQPRKERFDAYLALAGRLRPILETIEGFIDNERFESLRRPGWLLSHSSWRDEKSVVRWRTVGEHHAVQQQGRGGIFADYHLRVGEVTADSAPPAGLPLREQRFDETEVGVAKVASLTEIMPEPGEAAAAAPEAVMARLGVPAGALVEHDLFRSITTAGKLALLLSWRDREAAQRWRPEGARLRHRRIRIIRDYGMFDRREAPQYYPEVRREA